MNTDELEEKLWEVGEPVDMEVFVTNKTVEIKNFKVPKSKQGTGEKIGPTVMQKVIQLAKEHSMNKIVLHIDWTHRDETGYATDKDPQNDPSVKFLKDHDFTIDKYNTDVTLRGTRKI